MSTTYRTFFGMKEEAFAADLSTKEIFETDDIRSVQKRFHYAVRLGTVALVTGEIGSGKSTALRYVAAKLHPSEYRPIHITACSGSILEFYRMFLAEMNIDKSSTSRVVMIRLIKKEVQELVLGKKLKVVLILDEASLMRLEVFAELHTITQFEQDSKPWLPIILAGKTNLIDLLTYQTSTPLASRIVARSHLEPANRKYMGEYLNHHLSITGVKNSLFDDAAITAVHQGSGGLFRKANNLARGALIAAANEQSMAVTADHVRLAATEVF
ncbi:ExeA family protein [Thermodesulfobacteriota bacterium]